MTGPMLVLGADARGPQDPIVGSPARRPGSIRRTSSIDTSWPEGFGGETTIIGLARDLRTTDDGGDVVAEVELALWLAPDRTIREVAVTGDGADADLGVLVGVRVGPGFRSAAGELTAAVVPAGTLLGLLLDDLSGAALVSGYAMLASGLIGQTEPTSFDARADLCAGWVDDGVMLAAIRDTGTIPAPVGPPAGALEPPDDPLGWHAIPPRPAPSTRRRRLIDVRADRGATKVESLFRDSHTGEDGVERSVHEYAITALLGRDRVVEAITATPRVLPWRECPNACSSVGRVVGRPIGTVREQVRSTFRGVTTCTHLNDMLSDLADVDHLLDALPAPPPG